MKKMAVVTMVLAAFVVPFSAYAQSQFGKNKVVYDSADWVSIESEHFVIYFAKNHFPEGELRLWAQKMRQGAEDGYREAARKFGIEFTQRRGLVVFANHVTFERTHMQPGLLPEGVLAFASAETLHVAIPLGAPEEEIVKTLAHEVVHLFQYQFYWNNILGRLFQSNAPGWVLEGEANHLSGVFETSTDLRIASLVLEEDAIPSLAQLTFSRGWLSDYALGYLVWAYMEEKFGEKKVYEYRIRLKESVRWDPLGLIRPVFGVDLVTFDEGFRKYLRSRYLPRLLEKQAIDRIADPVMKSGSFPSAYSSDGTARSAFFANSVASPGGDVLAGFGVNYDRGAIELIIVSSEDGSFVRSLSDNHSYVSDYLHPVAQGITAVEQAGADIAFSPDGSLVAFFGRTEPDRTLILVDVGTGEIVQRRRMNDFADSPLSPSFSLDGRLIFFSATSSVQRDLWVWDRQTDALSPLTDDRAWDFSPVMMNEDVVAYIATVEGFKKVFTLNLETGVRSQRTFGQTNETMIARSSSGRLAVVSDRGGIYNLHDLNVEAGTMDVLTDVAIGVLHPSFLPTNAGEEIVVSSPVAGNFRPFRLRDSEPLSRGTVRGFAPMIVSNKKLTPLLGADDIEPADTTYKFQLGPIHGGYSTGFGYSALLDFSFCGVEMPFQDRSHCGRVLSYGPYRLLSYQYLNRHRRFTWGVGVSYYRLQGLTFDLLSGSIGSRVFYGTDSISVVGLYPLSFWRRFEFEAGWRRRSYAAVPPGLEGFYRNGTYLYFRTSFVSDSVRASWFGPVEGVQVRVDVENGIPVGTLKFTDLKLETRRYWRLSSESVLAVRFWGFASLGRDPSVLFFGGQDQVRGVSLWSLSGNRGFYMNAEGRFPLFADSTLGPVRITAFLDVADVGFANNGNPLTQPFLLREQKISYGPGIQAFLKHLRGLPISVFYDIEGGRFSFVLGQRW